MRLMSVGLLVAMLAGPSFIAAPVSAQTTSASVTGTVIDSSRAVMPGVTVTLTSKSQGDVLTAVSDTEGRFVFPIVRPDAYVAQGDSGGLQDPRADQRRGQRQRSAVGRHAHAGGRFTAGERQRFGPVHGAAANSGERSFTMENEALTNIANNGRAMFNFATLVPGVLSQNTGGAEIAQVSGFTVNGQRPNSNNMTIDGVANIDTGDNGGNMATTNIDSVAEFKILTNAYQAEYGRAVGGQLQVVTKSGTQNYHGSGYWYGRRSNWNATNWLNNRDNLATPDSSRDDRGYTFGGPILKQKLFFFFSQEFQTRKDSRH